MNRVLMGLTALAIIGAFSCSPKEIVKVDFEAFNKNPGAYVQKHVIFKTDIETLIENPDRYHAKDVEITGFVRRGRPAGGFWGFKLQDESGKTLMCYETHYVHAPWINADMTVKKAMANNERITIVGNFRNNLMIELDWIEYTGYTIDTDYKPYVHRIPYRW